MSSLLRVEFFFRISGIFPPCFGCFSPADTADKKHVEIFVSHIVAVLKVSNNRLVAETHSLRDRDET